MDLLRGAYQHREDNGLIFPNRRGRPEGHFLNALQQVAYRAGIALLLNHHEETLYKAVRAGRLPVVRTFGSLRIDAVRLAGWLKQRGACSSSATVAGNLRPASKSKRRPTAQWPASAIRRRNGLYGDSQYGTDMVVADAMQRELMDDLDSLAMLEAAINMKAEADEDLPVSELCDRCKVKIAEWTIETLGPEGAEHMLRTLEAHRGED